MLEIHSPSVNGNGCHWQRRYIDTTLEIFQLRLESWSDPEELQNELKKGPNPQKQVASSQLPSTHISFLKGKRPMRPSLMLDLYSVYATPTAFCYALWSLFPRSTHKQISPQSQIDPPSMNTESISKNTLPPLSQPTPFALNSRPC